MYKSDGKDLLDMVEAHPQMYFLVYTNGTQIDREIAERMGELGNITPAISVEGKVKTTEERRGEGIFGKVMNAFENLRAAGVPFGLSMTATCYNCDELLSDDVLDFYFDEQGATYGWIFQYMPIGTNYDLWILLHHLERGCHAVRLCPLCGGEHPRDLQEWWDHHGLDGGRLLQGNPQLAA
jgi:MoaA/NifB/PqqE/SkfB family radical SAM enzyme